MSESNPDGYAYDQPEADHTQFYLWPPVFKELDKLTSPKRIFDLGCGNGALAAELAKKGFEVAGVDPSKDGIKVANKAHPQLNLKVGSAYDDLAAQFGQFPMVISFEVVEHVFYPRKYAKCVYDLLQPGGTAFISTPFHGYWKNLLIALTGKFDSHTAPLWDYGHIKFWSEVTLTKLLEEVGFKVERFLRVGRIPILAKGMVAIAKKPL
jgi:2-polyprenyl-3-methyl-5-hydroxy-6-metoxy-1,4-benzoquinol methylase